MGQIVATFVAGALSAQEFWTYSGEIVDSVPDAFAFADQIDVEPSTVIQSNLITVAGIESAAAISIVGGEYSIDGLSYTANSGFVNEGQTVRVRHSSSAAFLSAVNTTLTIGGVSDTFTSTTRAADVVPDAFVFNDQTGVARNVLVVSDSITVTGIEAPAAISIVGGEYSINGGSYTASPGNVSNGQQVTVRLTSAADYLTETDATLTIGGITDTFTATTLADVVNPSVILTGPGELQTSVFTVTVVFDEVVTDLLATDFVVTNASASNLQGSGANYTVDIAPVDNSLGNVLINLPADRVIDSGGNGNVAADELAVPFDTRPPQIVSVNAGQAVTAGSTINIVTIKTGVVAGRVRLFRNNTHYPLAINTWGDQLIVATLPQYLPLAGDYQLQVLFG